MLELAHKATPVDLPAAGKSKLYVKSDGLLYLMDSFGVEKVVIDLSPDEVVYVSSPGDLPAAVAGVRTLSSGYRYVLTQNVDIGTDYIDLQSGSITAVTPFVTLKGSHAGQVVQVSGTGAVQNLEVSPQTAGTFAVRTTNGSLAVLRGLLARGSVGNGVFQAAGASTIISSCDLLFAAGTNQTALEFEAADHSTSDLTLLGGRMNGSAGGAALYVPSGAVNLSCYFHGTEFQESGGVSIQWDETSPPTGVRFQGCTALGAVIGVSGSRAGFDVHGCDTAFTPSGCGTQRFVRQEQDFPVPVAGVITLEADADYHLCGQVTLSPGVRLVMPPGSGSIRGESQASSKLLGDYAGPLLEVTATYARFADLHIANSNSSGADLRMNAAGLVTNLERVRLRGSNVGLRVSAAASVSAQLSSCVGTAAVGLLVDGTVGSVGLDRCALSTKPGGTGNRAIEIAATAVFTNRFRVEGSTIIATDASDTGYLVADRAASFATGRCLMETVRFTGAGTPVSGQTPVDIECAWAAMDGVDNTTVGAAMYMYGNASPTTPPGIGTPVKVVGTVTPGAALDRFTHSAGRLTYVGEENIRVLFNGHCTLQGNNNKEIRLFVAVNGVAVESESHIRTSGTGDAHAVPLTGRAVLSTGDYVELFLANDTDTTDITVTNFHLAVAS